MNNINFDFIANLLLSGGLKATADGIKVSVDFYWKFERSHASLASILKIKIIEENKFKGILLKMH